MDDRRTPGRARFEQSSIGVIVSTVRILPDTGVVDGTGLVAKLVPISKNIETDYREGNLIPQADYAWGTTWRRRRLLDDSRTQNIRAYLVRGGHLGGRSLGDRGEQ